MFTFSVRWPELRCGKLARQDARACASAQDSMHVGPSTRHGGLNGFAVVGFCKPTTQLLPDRHSQVVPSKGTDPAMLTLATLNLFSYVLHAVFLLTAKSEDAGGRDCVLESKHEKSSSRDEAGWQDAGQSGARQAREVQVDVKAAVLGLNWRASY